MKRRLEREQLYFELFWILVTTFIAYVKFYDGFMYSKSPDLQAIAYTTIVFVMPILVSTKIYCDLFQLKYDEFSAKDKSMNSVIIEVHNILNYFFLYVAFISIAFLMLAFSIPLILQHNKIFLILVSLLYFKVFSMGFTIHILKYLKK